MAMGGSSAMGSSMPADNGSDMGSAASGMSAPASGSN
jgi:hypothetical protein